MGCKIMKKTNVINLFNDAPAQLRMIADEMEASENKGAQCTVIWDREVYQCMDSKIEIGDAAATAIFNCSLGIQKLTSAVLSGALD